MTRKRSFYRLTEIGKYCIITIADSFQKDSDLRSLFSQKRMDAEKPDSVGRHSERRLSLNPADAAITFPVFAERRENRLYLVKSRQTERKMLYMKDSGIMRRVDSLGRFVLPKELRRQLQIECNDYLQIYTEGEKIIIHKAQCNCALCGRTDDLIDFNDKKVCKSCIGLIKDYL